MHYPLSIPACIMYGHTPPFTQSISRTGWCEPGADVCHVHNVYVGPGLIPAVQARLVSPQTSLQPRPHLTGVCSASARCWAPSADSAHGQTMITQSLTSLRLMLGVETQRCSSPRIITPGLARRGHLAGVAYAQSPEPISLSGSGAPMSDSGSGCGESHEPVLLGSNLLAVHLSTPSQDSHSHQDIHIGPGL